MNSFDEKKLDDILKGTIKAIDASKTQIFDIYDGARTEMDHIKEDIEVINAKVRKIIEKVDTLEKEEHNARKKLVQVSSNFSIFSEADIRVCYEHTKNIQIELAVIREQEQNLRTQRNSLEMRLKRLRGTVDKAKQLVTQVGVVLGYLSAQMGDVVSQMKAVSQDKLFGAQVIKAQEAERLRVSREIHDGPAQLIANVIYRSSICERLVDLDTEKAKHELQGLREQIRGCLGEIRKIIFDLRPMTLDDLGLVATLHHFLDKFKKRTGVKVSLNVIGEECKINKHVEISIFRIIQEALNNIDKHAKTSDAKLSLEYNSEYISIYVEDFGKGFLIDDANAEDSGGEHYGLLGMKERVKILNGQFLIESILGRGTKIRILIPLSEIQEKEPEQ